MSPSLTVQEMVNAELQRDPDVSLTDLKWLAERVDPSVADLSDDEFKARYAADAGKGAAPKKAAPKKAAPKKAGRKTARKGEARRKSAAAAARKRPSAKATAKKAPAKKASVTTASAKKAPAKKASATTALAKKALAKKAGGTKATRKKSASGKATEKKAPRKATGGKSKKSETPATPGQELTRARAAFLDFARDLTAAESRGDLVKVLADVDRYARRVLKGGG